MYLLEPLEKLEESIFVYNNKQVCQEEIKSIICDKFETGKAFLKYNPLEFNRAIKSHPLIKSVVVRTRIIPEKTFSVLVNEEKPWAIFRNKLYNNELEIINDYSKDLVNFESVDDLYNSIISKQSKVLQINSNNELSSKEFKKLKKISDAINERLKMINQNLVISIKLIDGELTLNTLDFKLIWGPYKTGMKSKIKHFEYLLSKINETIDEIEYIDLSLETDEAIIGKRL